MRTKTVSVDSYRRGLGVTPKTGESFDGIFFPLLSHKHVCVPAQVSDLWGTMTSWWSEECLVFGGRTAPAGGWGNKAAATGQLKDKSHRQTQKNTTKLTITTLAKCAETRAYTPPDDPTTGAVISVTETAKDPEVIKDTSGWSTQRTNSKLFSFVKMLLNSF